MAEALILERNATEQTNLISTIDMDVPTIVQPILNHLYSGEYGEFWSYVVWGTPVANILGAILVFLLFLVFRKLFTKLVLDTLYLLAKKSETTLDDQIIVALRRPIRFAFVVVGLHLFFLLLFVHSEIIHLILETLIIYTIFWAVVALIETLRDYILNYADIDQKHSRELTDFIIKVIKGIAVIIGVSIALHNWGVNVTGIVASLGLGGLALALAAKDAVSNIFASITLLLDNTMKAGEWVKVAGVEGTVESVGMRTTRIRSFEKSLFVIPNHIIANGPIENFSRRGVRRIKMTLGLTYSTTGEQLEKIIGEIREMMQHHPGISRKDTLLVNFNEFSDSALGIFVYAFTDTAVWDQYLAIQEDVYMQMIRIVEKHGSSFAFPSQSLYIEQLPADGAKQTMV